MGSNTVPNSEFVRASNPVAAGTTVVNSDTIDFEGCSNVVFVVGLGAVTAGGVATVQFQSGNLADNSDMANVSGHSIAAVDASNKLLLLEVNKPLKRYGRITVARTVANSVVESVLAIKFSMRKAPVIQGVTVAAADVNLGS